MTSWNKTSKRTPLLRFLDRSVELEEWGQWVKDLSAGRMRQNPAVAQAVARLQSVRRPVDALAGDVQRILGFLGLTMPTSSFGAFSDPLDAVILDTFARYLTRYTAGKWAHCMEQEREVEVSNFFRFVLRALGYAHDAPTQVAFWRRHYERALDELRQHAGVPENEK